MAGLWSFSQQQILDGFGKPIVGAEAFFYDAETLTPQAIFADFSMGVPLSNPVVADGFGRFPPVYLDENDNFFRHRIQTPQGVVIVDLTTLPIIGPSGGGGGGETPVDPNSLFATGDPMWSLRTGIRTGWVRANARTIGNAVSGATERANADTSALFSHLWLNIDNTICPVSGGRGASAAADFAANKTIGLPDMRGRAAIGLDTMGNSAANRINLFGNDGTILAASGGAETVELVKGNLPAITIALTGTAEVVGNHTHPIGGSTGNAGAHDHGGNTGNAGAHDHTYTAPHTPTIAFDSESGTPDTRGLNLNTPTDTLSTSSEASHAHTISNQANHAHTLPADTGNAGSHSHDVAGSTSLLGSGAAVNKMSPATLGTWYLKL